jgi:[ribosomal protein S5]-alanine N-acetyltransferase
MLRTRRLVLARPGLIDVDAIWRIHRDPVACAYNPSDMLADRAEAVERCGQWMAHWERHGFGYFVLRRTASGEVAGFCGLKLMRLHDAPVLNLFYRLAPAASGAGLASEAAAAVVAQAPADPLLIARVRPGNQASIRVAEKAGLRRTPHLDTQGDDGPDWIYTHPGVVAR